MPFRIARRSPSFLVAAIGALGFGLPSLVAAATVTMPGAARHAPTALRTLDTFGSIDAVQGVAVDARHVYVLGDRAVSRHDRASGAPELRRIATRDELDVGMPIVHLNGGVVQAGRLYAAHSDWPRVPTRSSIEIFDTVTLTRVASHPFGARRGALTWLDRHAGRWWAVFTDYGRAPPPAERAARELLGTRLVEMDDDFAILRAWAFPRALLRRFAPMSNSGGSWGPNGQLWLTGHDRGEAYIVVPPVERAVLDWRATVALPDIEGQGIAWYRDGDEPTLYGLQRSRRRVVRMRRPRSGNGSAINRRRKRLPPAGTRRERSPGTSARTAHENARRPPPNAPATADALRRATRARAAAQRAATTDRQTPTNEPLSRHTGPATRTRGR